MTIISKYYGANGWHINLGNINILIDPWIKGELVFPPGAWLLKGILTKDALLPDKIDLLLLTQGLPDHAHIETLNLIPKDINVIASRSAAKIVRKLGFKYIIELKPGNQANFKDLKIIATKGALVPQLENGYILSHPEGSVYLEPHGFLDETICPQHMDLVISPVVDIALPLVGNFINGKSILRKLIEVFNPSTILASTTGGEIIYEGILSSFIHQNGNIEEAKNLIPESVKLIDPKIGIEYNTSH